MFTILERNCNKPLQPIVTYAQRISATSHLDCVAHQDCKAPQQSLSAPSNLLILMSITFQEIEDYYPGSELALHCLLVFFFCCRVLPPSLLMA